MGRISKADQAEAAANEKIQDTLCEITKKLSKVKSKNEKVNEAVKAIKHQGERLVTNNNGKMTQANKLKISALYDTAMKQCESEEDTLRRVLSDIEKVRKLQFDQKRRGQMRRGELMQFLQQQARTLPLWIGKVEGHPPALVGGIPLPESVELSPGDYVAAYVDDIWLMAEIKENNGSKKYTIKDIDDETDRTYAVTRARMIPLPKYRADPNRDGHALFPRDAIVLALYPQTTCFYKGCIEITPSTPTDDYMIAFEDPAYASGFSPPMPAPQGFVINYKEIPASPMGRKKKAKKADDDDD